MDRNRPRVKILISSHVFLPSVGGLENVSAMLADDFVRVGHKVKLVTQTPCAEELLLAYPVIRRPRPLQLLGLLRWCEVYFHNHISLRTAWPLLFVRRPWVVTHETWIPFSGLTGRLKHWAIGVAINVSVSTLIARHVGAPTVIGNPYDDEGFQTIPGIARDKELVFCGRLVSEKGVDLLLNALSILKSRKLHPRLTIVGSGPGEPKLCTMVGDLGIADQVTFAGVKKGRELAEYLNAHKIMVVPSLWNEPFGVVALEGIACGCVIVGSEGGGLKEAIGPCGVTFPNGDASALATRLGQLLSSPESLVHYRAKATEHLSHHTKSAVGEKYLRVFATALDSRSSESIRARRSSEAESVYGVKY